MKILVYVERSKEGILLVEETHLQHNPFPIKKKIIFNDTEKQDKSGGKNGCLEYTDC